MSYKIFLFLITFYSFYASTVAVADEAINTFLQSKIFDKEHFSGSEKLPDLLVFISFSMPEQSLKQLSEQVKKAKGVLVLRGMYQGSLKKTVNMLYALNKQGVSAIIHPKLFTEYEVTKAPTIILRDSKNQCDEENSCTAVIDKISGNVPISYALRYFVKEGHHSSLAKKYLLMMGEKDV